MASGSKKRSYAEFASVSDPTLTVITADGGRIPAHNEVLRLVCSCFRDAPASDTWDLSSLLVNDSPVSQQTVEAVLSVLYGNMCALGYEPHSTAGQYSLPQLLEMLLFADAVGCSKAALNKLAGLLGSAVRPQLEVKLTASQAESGSGTASSSRDAAADSATACRRVALRLDGVYSNHESSNSLVAVKRWQGFGSVLLFTITAQQFKQLQQELSKQLEALLFVGFKLDLQQLLQPALRFLRASSPFLMGEVTQPRRVSAIFTARVLAAAGGATNAELLSRSYLQVALGSGVGEGSVFDDLKYKDASGGDERDKISFTATLKCDLYESSAGMRVQVSFNCCDELMHIKPVTTTTDSGDSGSGDEDGGEFEVSTAYTFGVVLGPNHSF